MSVYADTSALFSLYWLDANSAAAARTVRAAAAPPTITPFGELELANAIRLAVFRRLMSPAQAATAQSLWRRDLAAGVYRRAGLPPRAFADAERLAARYTPTLGTRTLDMLHVACARSLKATLFITFDRRQAALARAVGLTVAP